jgi:hypothetical protein
MIELGLSWNFGNLTAVGALCHLCVPAVQTRRISVETKYRVFRACAYTLVILQP